MIEARPGSVFTLEARYEAPETIEKIRAGLLSAVALATERELTPYEEQTSFADYAAEVDGARGPYGDFIEDGLEPHELEIQRAFEQFNLPKLTVERLREMPAGERSRLATHFVSFIHLAGRHGSVFAADGGPDPLSVMYREHDFASPEQAMEYGRKLMRFAHTVKMQPAYRYLDAYAPEHKTQRQIDVMNKRVQADIKNRGGRPTVYTDTKTGKLKLWYE